MDNWVESSLGEVGDVITGKTPSKKYPEHFGNLVPFVTPTDFKNYHKSIFNAERYLSKKGVDALSKKILPSNSVLVTCIGSDMGKVAINRVKCVTNQQINSITVKDEVANADFLYYMLSNMTKYLKQLARGGTTMPIVNKGTFENINIKIPPLEEQKAIAATLSCLDDKIELNNRMNQTLEEMAQAIFKSWFVDFEPFQDGEFVDSELGRIPKGWEIGTIEDLTVDMKNGGTPSRKNPRYWKKREFPWLKTGEIKNAILIDAEEWISIEGLENSSAKLLPKNTVLIALYGATAGQVGFFKI